MGNTDPKVASRQDLHKYLDVHLSEAFRILVELRGRDKRDVEDIQDKAREQAISLIVDSGSRSDTEPDDLGDTVGNRLQTLLMMAVLCKSDIFDHLDEPHIGDKTDKVTKAGMRPEPDNSHKVPDRAAFYVKTALGRTLLETARVIRNGHKLLETDEGTQLGTYRNELEGVITYYTQWLNEAKAEFVHLPDDIRPNMHGLDI